MASGHYWAALIVVSSISPMLPPPVGWGLQTMQSWVHCTRHSSTARPVFTLRRVRLCFHLQVLDVQVANYSAAIVHNSQDQDSLVQMAGGECECWDRPQGLSSVMTSLNWYACSFRTHLSPTPMPCATVSETAPDAFPCTPFLVSVSGISSWKCMLVHCRLCFQQLTASKLCVW